jgi:dolichol-phosphate mannosyltransferase
MILQSASISRTSDTLVFAPTFNERLTILLDDLLSLPERVDVLIVDDLSCDGTAEYLTARAATAPRLRVIMRPGKLGVGSAHKLAWLQARQHGYSRLVTLDADLSHDPQDVSRVLALLDGGADVAFGSQFLPGVQLQSDRMTMLAAVAALLFLLTCVSDLRSKRTSGQRSVLSSKRAGQRAP